MSAFILFPSVIDLTFVQHLFLNVFKNKEEMIFNFILLFVHIFPLFQYEMRYITHD